MSKAASRTAGTSESLTTETSEPPATEPPAPEPPDTESEVLDVLLSTAGAPQMRFTQEAGSLFEEKTFRYIGSLAKLSELASKHSSEEVVTMRHVEDASRFLGTGPRKRLWVKACGVAGAMLFGTGLAQMVNMAGDDKYTGTGVWLSVILLVAGGLTAAYHVISE